MMILFFLFYLLWGVFCVCVCVCVWSDVGGVCPAIIRRIVIIRSYGR